ncbi:MAG: hypothetical protein RL265_1316, partial [Bacteroidota bacterium]
TKQSEKDLAQEIKAKVYELSTNSN